jgi:hypothetical protein
VGYYGPSFGGLDQGWYFRTTDRRYADERDRCLEWWNVECDAVVEDYLRRHGMFLSAFERAVKSDIRTRLGENSTFPAYFGYFIVSRVLETPRLARLYREDYESRSGRTVTCSVCNNCQTYDGIHPSLIGRTGRVLPLCNKCWFWIAEFTPLESLTYVSEDFKERVRRLSSQQTCPICHRKFVWLRKEVRYTFEVPFLPARHIEICPRCVQAAVWGDPRTGTSQSHLDIFKRIADLLGAVPDRTGFVYDQAETLEIAIEVTKLMHEVPSFQALAKQHGSWFKLLVASGVLPNGTRPTAFGVMVLARDGHQCLSLAEKTIDDLLFDHRIPHEKEPRYPGADYRADWKLVAAGTEVFIELFGLDGEPSYTKRKQEKLAYAEKAGMTVVALERKDLVNLKHAFQRKILALFADIEPKDGLA